MRAISLRGIFGAPPQSGIAMQRGVYQLPSVDNGIRIVVVDSTGAALLDATVAVRVWRPSMAEVLRQLLDAEDPTLRLVGES